jgi:hypothetical protein
LFTGSPWLSWWWVNIRRRAAMEPMAALRLFPIAEGTGPLKGE